MQLYKPGTAGFLGRLMNTMINNSRKNSRLHGFTIVEVMVAMAIVIVIAMGTLSFQYNNVRQNRTSEAQTAAARIGQLLLEDWKSSGGDTDYDPNLLGLGFTYVSANNYRITLDYQTFYINLARQLATVSSGTNPDTVAGVTLWQLTITINWRKDFGTGTTSSSDPSLVFTTYVRLDT
jgi:prepilin-type N-terminal cleavage/methylation domain-containing protein